MLLNSGTTGTVNSTTGTLSLAGNMSKAGAGNYTITNTAAVSDTRTGNIVQAGAGQINLTNGTGAFTINSSGNNNAKTLTMTGNIVQSGTGAINLTNGTGAFTINTNSDTTAKTLTINSNINLGAAGTGSLSLYSSSSNNVELKLGDNVETVGAMSISAISNQFIFKEIANNANFVLLGADANKNY